MRLILAGVVLVVIGVGALMAPIPASDNQPTTTSASTTATTSDPYGAPLGADSESPASTPADPVSTSTTSSTSGSTEASTAVMGEETTLIDDTVEVVHDDNAHSEEEPADEFPDLAEGEFPITTNIEVDAGYPLAAMAELAVDLLRAELTGEGADGYPHLADTILACCEDLRVDGVAVLFGPTQADSTSIVVDWHADAAGPESRTIRGTTETKWWWSDGTWIGEYDRQAVEQPQP